MHHFCWMYIFMLCASLPSEPQISKRIVVLKTQASKHDSEDLLKFDLVRSLSPYKIKCKFSFLIKIHKQSNVTKT